MCGWEEWRKGLGAEDCTGTMIVKEEKRNEQKNGI